MSERLNLQPREPAEDRAVFPISGKLVVEPSTGLVELHVEASMSSAQAGELEDLSQRRLRLPRSEWAPLTVWNIPMMNGKHPIKISVCLPEDEHGDSWVRR